MDKINEKLLTFIKMQIDKYYPKDNIKVYLFGSRASKTNYENSDYDLAFDIPEHGKNAEFLLTIQEDAPTLCGIDAVNLSKAPDNLKYNIINKGVLIYESAKKR